MIILTRAAVAHIHQTFTIRIAGEKPKNDQSAPERTRLERCLRVGAVLPEAIRERTAAARFEGGKAIACAAMLETLKGDVQAPPTASP